MPERFSRNEGSSPDRAMTPERRVVRVSLVHAFAAHGTLLNDNSIDLLGITIDPWRT
jgi:hypothetical protein